MNKKVKKLVAENKLLTLILVLAALLRLVGLMPNIPYADEAHIQVYSYDIVKNILLHFDFHPHTFKYGSWIFYFQAAVAFPVFMLTYVLHSTKQGFLPLSTLHEEVMRKYSDLFLVSGRLSIAILGIINVFVLYLIGKRLFNKNVGLIAALLLAVSPMHVRESHYMITDVFFLLSILTSFYFLILTFQEKKTKWFVLSGLSVGICSTIRYFPIIGLVYPIAILLSFEKSKNWLQKVVISFQSIIVGAFIGVPFLFFDKRGLNLLARELEKYALPWYETTTSKIFLSKVFWILSLGRVQLHDVPLLYEAPNGFRPLHASWIFFNGLGPIPVILSIVGIILLFFKDIKKTILLGIIPVFYFIYISFSLPAIYEKLSLPILPFLAIFAAIALQKILVHKIKFFWIILAFAVTPQIIRDMEASIACGQVALQKQSSNWVEENIPDESKVAYLTMVSVPSTKSFAVYYPLEPKYFLSLEEARAKGADYVFWSGSRIDYETYPYFNDFFVLPSRLYQNSYEISSLLEYETRAQTLNKITRPLMCDPARIYYYKLPPLPIEAKKDIKKLQFENADDLNSWSVENYGYEKASVHQSNKMIEFRQQKVHYTPPKLVSDQIPVEPGKTYTFSLLAKKSASASRVIARLEFTGRDTELTSFEKLNNFSLLMWEGATPLHYEKRINRRETIAISPRVELDKDWEKISITSVAPNNADKVSLSIQNTNKEAASFYIDDVELKESE